MDNFKGRIKKKRSKRMKNPPPPLFTSDRTPKFGPRNVMPNRSPPFPDRYGTPPVLPMNSDEMFDRFNQLLDWDLPQQGNSWDNPSGIFDEYNNDRKFEPPLRPNYITHRTPDDLRNRLDQQNKWKMQEGFGIHEPTSLEEDWPSRERYSRSDISDRRDFGDRLFKSDLIEERRRQTEINWDNRDRDAAFNNMQRRLNSEKREFDKRGELWPDGDGRHYLIRDDRQNIGRQVKEYWPEGSVSEREFSQKNDRCVVYSQERGYPDVGNEDFDNNREGYSRNLYNTDRFSQSDRHYGARMYEENVESRKWGTEPFSGENDDRDRFMNRDLGHNDQYSNYDQQNISSNPREMYSMENMSSASTFNRPCSPLMGAAVGGPKREIINSGSGQHPVAPFRVIIVKSNNEKFTNREADFLRSKLIDRLVHCENPVCIPEFTNSGLNRGARVFSVTCRTQETMNWLLQQPLPLLNGVQLYMQQQKENDTVHITAFVTRCTRTKEEAWKLLKLQNSKKGLNFDNWYMKNYQCAPNGVLMDFDVAIDEARHLRDLGCNLSFELKTIKFKIPSEK